MPMKDYLIYSIEDDPDISDILSLALRGQGFSISCFASGEEFFEAFKKKKPNMILLDMMLPGIQGMDILKSIRKDESNQGIIIVIVSAKSLVSDKIDGLNFGADDYIAKPFDINEFISRINAHYRRYHHIGSVNPDLQQVRNCVIDFSNRTLKQDGVLVNLTPSEFSIAKLLFENYGKTVTKAEISKELYGVCEDEEKLKRQFRTIDMMIKELRRKLHDEDKTFIQTVFGSGYLLNE